MHYLFELFPPFYLQSLSIQWSSRCPAPLCLYTSLKAPLPHHYTSLVTITVCWCSLQGGASHVALYVALLAVFSATVGAQATIIAVGEHTASLPACLLVYLSCAVQGGACPSASPPHATITTLVKCAAAGCNTSGKAGLIMNLVLLLSLLFGGFLVNVASIPVRG